MTQRTEVDSPHSVIVHKCFPKQAPEFIQPKAFPLQSLFLSLIKQSCCIFRFTYCLLCLHPKIKYLVPPFMVINWWSVSISIAGVQAVKSLYNK